MAKADELEREICDIGRRVYAKGFAAANDGNLSVRLNEREVLCTPTLICKGFMQPADLCVVDMQGRQLRGQRKRTSEIMLHLAIMQARPEIQAVVHCHPPHATAFGIAREPIPQCVLPEVEIFLGNVPITRYAIPGSQEFADTILPFVHQTNVVVLANHGTVSFGDTLERAYWWTEVLDAYCHILMLARSLGRVSYFSAEEAQALLELKAKWGFTDPRNAIPGCDLFANEVFRDTWPSTGVAPRAFTPPAQAGPAAQAAGSAAKAEMPTADLIARLAATVGRTGDAAPVENLIENLVEAIAARVAERLRNG